MIAAVFCMFNLYVDGLSAITPDDPAIYEDEPAIYEMVGKQRAVEGYLIRSVLMKDPEK